MESTGLYPGRRCQRQHPAKSCEGDVGALSYPHFLSSFSSMLSFIPGQLLFLQTAPHYHSLLSLRTAGFKCPIKSLAPHLLLPPPLQPLNATFLNFSIQRSIYYLPKRPGPRLRLASSPYQFESWPILGCWPDSESRFPLPLHSPMAPARDWAKGEAVSCSCALVQAHWPGWDPLSYLALLLSDRVVSGSSTVPDTK